MRKTDQPGTNFFRVADRVFCLNGEWYFQTRHEDRGPYTKRETAEAALARYTEEMNQLNKLDTENIPSYQSLGAERREKLGR